MRRIYILAMLMIVISGCSIVPKYHSKGINISWNSKIYNGGNTHSISNGKKPNQNSTKNSNSSLQQTLDLSQGQSAALSANTKRLNACMTSAGLRKTRNQISFDYAADALKNSYFISSHVKTRNTNTPITANLPVDSAKSVRPKKTLEQLDLQLRQTEEKIRDNFEGFALLLSPLLINASGRESKFIMGWNITFFTLSFLCFFFAIFYCIKYVFQWSRFTILRHTKK